MTGALALTRLAVYRCLPRWAQSGRLRRNIALVGGGEQARRLLLHLERQSEPWNQVVGVFDERRDRGEHTLLDRPPLATLDDLVGPDLAGYLYPHLSYGSIGGVPVLSVLQGAKLPRGDGYSRS